jgi:hypothetical protein
MRDEKNKGRSKATRETMRKRERSNVRIINFFSKYWKNSGYSNGWQFDRFDGEGGLARDFGN